VLIDCQFSHHLPLAHHFKPNAHSAFYSLDCYFRQRRQDRRHIRERRSLSDSVACHISACLINDRHYFHGYRRHRSGAQVSRYHFSVLIWRLFVITTAAIRANEMMGY